MMREQSWGSLVARSLRWGIFAAALASALGAGCSDDDPVPAAPATTTTAADGGAGGDGEGAGGGTAGGGGAPLDRLEVGATDSTITLPFLVAVDGASAKKLDPEIGAVKIDGDVGTVEVHGAVLPAFTYEEQPFGQWTLYQTLAVAPDALYVLWLYCNGPTLEYVWFEGTDGTTMKYEPATGSCAAMAASTEVAVKLPAVDMAVPALLGGVTMDGPSIHYDGMTPGTIDLGTLLVLLPFDQVDCSDCGGAGWYEVHSLLWDPKGRLCFAIVYLFAPGDPMLVTYSLTLPDLSDPAGSTSLPGSWAKP